MRVNLNCPFDEKDEAKLLGARWDSGKRVWYVDNPRDMAPFMRWVDQSVKTKVRRKKQTHGRHQGKPAGATNGFCTIGAEYVDEVDDSDIPPWEYIESPTQIRVWRLMLMAR